MEKKLYLLFFIIFLIALILGKKNLFAQPIEKSTVALKHKVEMMDTNEKLLIWIFFNDKGDNIDTYYLKPQSIVSEKSLLRREKISRNNSLIDFSDLPIFQSYIEKLSMYSFKVKQKSKWFNGVSGFADKIQIKSILNLRFVKKLDIVTKLAKYNEERSNNLNPPDKDFKLNQMNSFPQSWLIDYGESIIQNYQINVPAVHDMGILGQGVTICLMDVGFLRLSHEVFSHMNIIAKWDFVDNDSTVDDSSFHYHYLGGHGTATLSVIGGFKPGKLIGPAFASNYILARTEDIFSETPIEEDNWIAAIEWADSIGVDVTSTSLSYLTFDSTYQSYTWENMDGKTARITIAADLAVKKGIVVVNSADNGGYDSLHNTLGAPADGDSVIAVGAVYPSGERAEFSSVGNTTDGRIKPDVMALGVNVIIADAFSGDTAYSTASGTSLSCPLAAGVAALILSQDPSLTPIQVRDAMRNTASNFYNPNREYGWGILNAFKALKSIVNVTDNFISTSKFILYQNYPNPFNPTTNFGFRIANSGFVSLKVFDLLGREVSTLVNEEKPAGTFKVIWNAANLPSGVYFYQLKSGSYTTTKKLLLIK